jgi:hypothetical protein
MYFINFVLKSLGLLVMVINFNRLSFWKKLFIVGKYNLKVKCFTQNITFIDFLNNTLNKNNTLKIGIKYFFEINTSIYIYFIYFVHFFYFFSNRIMYIFVRKIF